MGESSALLTGASAITVASVPGSHVYVQHIAAPDHEDDGVSRLLDPDPDDPTRSISSGRWWPPVMLDPAWVRRSSFDVFHVHFGFDGWRPEDLGAVVDAVHETGRRFVLTVHDLRNPHHLSPALHTEQLGVLVGGADELITLTPGAAGEVERRWGRAPHVLPHPHVVPLPEIAARAERTRQPGPFRIGLHLKSLRPNTDPLAVLPVLADEVAATDGAVLQVNAHRDVMEPGGERFSLPLRDWLRGASDTALIDLRVHDYLDDGALWDYLAALDASVLPYRFGTHSGWLEACRDLGTAVIAPTCGFYDQQGPVHSFDLDEDAFDAESLRRAVRAAVAAGAPAPLEVGVRREQRAGIARAHRRIYAGDR